MFWCMNVCYKYDLQDEEDVNAEEDSDEGNVSSSNSQKFLQTTSFYQNNTNQCSLINVVPLCELQKKKRKGKKVKLADRNDLFGDDGLELSSATERTNWNAYIPGSSSGGGGAGKKSTTNLTSTLNNNNKKNKVTISSSDNNDSSGSSNNVKQMELMRKRVIEAYAKIREKRRSTSAAYQT